jgi:MutS domain V
MNDISSTYRERIEQCVDEAGSIAQTDQLVARARIVLFLATVGIFFVAWGGGGGTPFYVTGVGALVAFIAAVGYHDHLERRLHRIRTKRKINEQGLARLSRDWSNLPIVPIEVPSKHLATANDLDLFGKASLFQLLCRADTDAGQTMLRDWLTDPATPDQVASRQQAVRELAPLLELREEFNIQGSLLADCKTGPAEFIAWAESEPWLRSRMWLLWTARLLPVCGVLILAALVLGSVSAEVAGFSGIAIVVLNGLISVLFTGTVHDIFNAVSTRNGQITRYVAMFELMYEIPDSTSRLAAIKEEVTMKDRSALKHLHELSWIISFGRISHDAVLWVVYILLQLFFLWDFHVLARLETWQATYGKLTRRWFDALGEFEAIASLASLSHDNPDWCFPKISSECDRVSGTSVGHPLLQDEERVANDIEVGPDGHFLLVTGSNMAGKSTLLRSIGINAVLAEAGAPVCAMSWSLPPLEVATSMRISDSLQDHVSFFMAELRRLKAIVDQATAAQGGERQLLFLLDEILQGTNSTERHIAVVEVLSHLLASGALGAVSTHDLELANSPEISSSCTTVHLRETLHGSGSSETMTFDYQLRPGIAPTTNALKLLELVGLREKQGR